MELNLTGNSVDEEEDFLPNANHLCWIYDNDSDKFGVVKPYMATQLSRRNRCLLVMPRADAEQVLASSREDGPGIDRYLESGQLVVAEPEDVVFAGGPFDIDVVMHRLEETRKQALADGWEKLAVVSDLSGLLDREDPQEWLDLEFRVDFECLTQPLILLCLFDARKASGTFITSIIKVHPAVGLGRGLARNPFYQGEVTRV